MLDVVVKAGQPSVAGTALPVAAVVHACHEKTIDVGMAELAVPGLDRATLEPILTYCAEQRCKADGATCHECRLRTEKLGIKTFDDFVAHHAEITFEHSPLVLRGHGTETLRADSLEELAKTWAGEEYWFWARRVLRKLRHGIRRARQSGAPPPGAGNAPVFVLVRPQLADNIGMVARALANFGLDELRLIAPRDGWPNEKARIAASGANFIVDSAQAFATLAEGVAGLNWVAATSARQRDLVKPVLTPEQAVAEMLRRTGEGQRCGMLFGPERNGLETDEIANADAVVMAPVNPNFASLNLAQAVLLHRLRMDETGRQRNIGARDDLRGAAGARSAHAGLGSRGQGGPDRPLRAPRIRARERRLLHRARKAPQHRAEYALDVRAHGRNGARNPHLAGNCEGPCAGTA